MATAEPRRVRAALPVLVPVALVVAAAGLVGVRWAVSDDPSGARAPLAVTAESIYEFSDLASMVERSDLVVRGRVEATSRGRTVGEVGAAVISRIVTVQIDEVLAGAATTPAVLVEEEGWLPDGTSIEVNGLAPSAEGMEAIWFLDRLPDDGELPGYVVINHQGRYAVEDGRLRGADGDDPLVHRIEQLPPEALAADVRSLGAAAAG